MQFCGAENLVSAAPSRSRASSSSEARALYPKAALPARPSRLKCSGQELAPRTYLQFLENALNVRHHRPELRFQLGCDRLVGKALLNKRHDFALSRREIAVVVGREAQERTAVSVPLLAKDESLRV